MAQLGGPIIDATAKSLAGKFIKGSISPSLSLIADALGLSIDSVEVRGGQGVTRNDTQIAAGLVPAATVGATRTVVSCIKDGKPLIEFQAIWYVASDVDTSDGEDWNFRDSGWRVLVEGDTPRDVTIRYPVSAEDYPAFTPNLTAHRSVNCIPYVCAATPGFVNTLDLPPIVARLG